MSGSGNKEFRSGPSWAEKNSAVLSLGSNWDFVAA